MTAARLDQYGPALAPPDSSAAPLDPSRAPLDPARLHAAFGGRLDVRIVGEVASTNAEVAAAARAGAADGTVLAAERQNAGRGRLGRRWQSPPGSGLAFSWLVRPDVPAASLGWLPLVVGTAVATALRSRAGVPAVLEWPNDVLTEGTGGGKIAGILVELAPDSGRPPAAVVGIGLNVSPAAGELPAGAASVGAYRRRPGRCRQSPRRPDRPAGRGVGGAAGRPRHLGGRPGHRPR